jgi:hypothetical protein
MLPITGYTIFLINEIVFLIIVIQTGKNSSAVNGEASDPFENCNKILE